MEDGSIVLYPDNSPNSHKFQQCTVGSLSTLDGIPEFKNLYDAYASLEVTEDNTKTGELEFHYKILIRINRGWTIPGKTNIIKINVRVLQLLTLPESVEDEQSIPKGSTREEMALARQVVKKTTPFEFPGPGMHFVKDLATSLDKIKILKSGHVSSMTVTVISTEYPDDDIDDEFSTFSQIIAAILGINGIRVAPHTLVDLRYCPIAKSYKKMYKSWGTPVIEFVYIDECQFRDEGTMIGKINSQTVITVNNFHHLGYYKRLVEFAKKPSPPDIIGLEPLYNYLDRNVDVQSLPPNFVRGLRVALGVIVSGPEGSGVKQCIDDSARFFRANCLNHRIAMTSNEYTEDGCRETTKYSSGGSICEIFDQALCSAKLYHTFLIIEGLERLDIDKDELRMGLSKVKHRKSRATIQKQQLITVLCHIFDDVPEDCKLTVLAVTSKAYLIPPALRVFGRFSDEVFINVPFQSTRLKLLQLFTSNHPEFQNVDLSDIAEKTPARVRKDLLKLVHRILQKMKEDGCNLVSDAHVEAALIQSYPSAHSGTFGLVEIQGGTSLDHIAGLDAVKEDLINAIVWPLKFPHAFLRMGIEPAKGILLYGPPGCGKTSLVRALAGSHQTNFISVSAAELYASGVGDSEKIVAHLFHRARSASPCILFFDELDSIVSSRPTGSYKGSSRTVNDHILAMILTEMDGIGARADMTPTPRKEDLTDEELAESFGPRVIVVGATNRPDLIDSALLRPGRFDRIIPVPPPDEAGRLDLLKKSSAKTPLAPDVDFEKLAKETEYYSCSDLVKLLQEGALCALGEDINIPSVSMKHYIKALAESYPTLKPADLLSFYEYSSGEEAAAAAAAIRHLTNKMSSTHLS